MKLNSNLKEISLFFLDCLKVYRSIPIFWLELFPLFLMPSIFYKVATWCYRGTIRKLTMKKYEKFSRKK
jgi:hypothetical protein